MRLFPKGMDGDSVWAPYLVARDEVERYPGDPQEPASQVSAIEYDDAAHTVTLILDLSLPSKCPRFASRACPRMISMGHENDLVGEALAARLKAAPRWIVRTTKPDDVKMLRVYAGFTSRPEAFIWDLLPLESQA